MQIIANQIRAQMAGASWIRKMFEKGIELKKQVGADKVFDFSLGNPDIPPPAKLRDAMIRLADDVVKPMGVGYCPNSGFPPFRAALAAHLARQQQVDLKPEHVIVTCGAAGALTSFFRAVIEPGDEVLVPAPYFVEYGSYCGHFGGVLKAIPSKAPDFTPDFDAMAAAVTDRTRVVMFNSPNNPTGAVYSRATVERLAAFVDGLNEKRDRAVFLVSDEPYRFLAYDGAEVAPVLPLSPYAVVMGSFSKNLSFAGERIGFVAMSPKMPDAELLAAAVTMTVRTLGFVNAPIIGQKLAMDLLEESADRSIYDRRREMMCAVLDGAGINYFKPQGAFYFFPEAPGGDDVAFVDALLAENILAVPGSGFGMKGHFRLSFSVEDRVISGSVEGFKRAAARFRNS